MGCNRMRSIKHSGCSMDYKRLDLQTYDDGYERMDYTENGSCCICRNVYSWHDGIYISFVPRI